jgi:dipeptidyl aminopeptidase/acylaminoacyl peptidase
MAAATLQLATTAGLLFAAPPDASLLDELKEVPHRIVYESYSGSNWELFAAEADGSNPVNLTRTADLDEVYPHVSPDGTKVCFLAFEGEEASMVRNLYWMDLDGAHRTRIAGNARWPCWKADGTAVAYLKNETDELSYADSATTGLFVYDLKTGRHARHPNKDIEHIYAICWSPDGKWFYATVHGGLGYKHAILAIEAGGMGVYDLGLRGCRPDVSADGKRLVWGASDWVMRVGDLDFSGGAPKVINKRDLVTSTRPMMIYHMEWSPDGKYVAFSRGPGTKSLGRHPAIIGVKVDRWDLCVADAAAADRWVPITNGEGCNKEPDWTP